MGFQISDNWLSSHSSYKCPKCNSKELSYLIQMKSALEQASSPVVMDGATEKVNLPYAYVEIHKTVDLDLDGMVECSNCLHEGNGWDFIDLEKTKELFKDMAKKRGRPDDSDEAVKYIKEHQTPSE